MRSLARCGLIAAAITSLALCGGTAASASAMSPPTTPNAPFNECPAIGNDTGCALLIDVTSSGTAVLQDPSQGTYDGLDDTLIGILNQSGEPVSEITLSSPTGLIFGFDSDGICTYNFTGDGYCSAQAKDGVDPYDYEGPDNTFSGISSDDMSGEVDFTQPLAPGQSTYFSLEEALTPSSITPPTNLTTTLSGGGKSGVSIKVMQGAAVTDSATLSGTNAASATGTVTYATYSDSACKKLVKQGAAEKITTPGTLPSSKPVTLQIPGTYYWEASYSGDANNGPSSSPCGSEMEKVVHCNKHPRNSSRRRLRYCTL